MKFPTGALLLWLVVARPLVGDELPRTPYAGQVAKQVERLHSESAQQRAGAAEAMGFLRATGEQKALIDHLRDRSPLVRREAAMALAWCGDRNAVSPLLAALSDEDWVTRQAAHVSLTNLTGMEFPFDSMATPRRRADQAKVWGDWWSAVPTDRPPTDLLAMVGDPKPWASIWSVSASSTYKGPPHILTDGLIGPAYWQTKNVPFPQWCTVDLGHNEEVAQVAIHQYGSKFVMTEYELATSLDNKTFDVIERKQGDTEVTLAVSFSPRQARYIRITSFGSKQPIYPTTFFEIRVNGKSGSGNLMDASVTWRFERGLRALGTLGGTGATAVVLECLGTDPPTAPTYRPMVRAAIRALGRLHQEDGFQTLIRLLDNPMWARYAADALGDFSDRRAVPLLLAAYPRYAKGLDGKDPPHLPQDDKMGFPSEDRMLHTPYAIAFSLCRLPLDDARDRAALRQIAPLVMANLPGDHDTFMLYEPEVGHLLTRHLLEMSGLRQAACEHAFELLGQPRKMPRLTGDPRWPVFEAYRMSSWLPAVCTDGRDLPRLVALLKHEEGWVRINAAKALAWLGDRRAIEPIATALSEAKAEADYGYNGTFKNAEYDDPAPRWRESLIRALGLLEAHEQTNRIARILNDERSVLEVRHAAAEALADLGNETALAALRQAASDHSFHSVRHVARDAFQVRGIELPGSESTKQASVDDAPAPGRLLGQAPPTGQGARPSTISLAAAKQFDAVVFIKGNNDIPNTIGTVEQADRWRQTYVVTDSGPVYRPGRNLYVLRPPRPDGEVTPLTNFPDGYVGEPELSWDASHVVFTHRGQDDPWWHIYRINVDGSSLEQLTDGPYHDVGPAYLADGRIVFATSRNGIRDEYHGYPCTALWVMNPKGGDMHPIATNIGRDNEPAILHDGRIVFSRLEVFFSRNKTELTVHAARPDGTQDVVLYGPERRAYWQRQYQQGPRGPGEVGNAPLTHRVLRISQPQPMPDGRNVIVATPGGLALIGPRRDTETIVTPDNKLRAFTTPFALPDGRVLCASTLKAHDRKEVDLGLYMLDPTTKKLELFYNDPATADFEPRPILARPRPPTLPTKTRAHAYSGHFVCSSVVATQEKEVQQRGRLVRLIEGVPVVGRHSTHTNAWPVWKNHGGTFARVLGTTPLAPDGSFYVEVPADRLLHFQVLDSDRQVVGNQLTWIYSRPGETKSCVGCHENPHTTPRTDAPLAAQHLPMNFLPRGDEFRYRAKAWFKGHLPPEIDERTRTVRAVNLLAR
ncbi:MAG: HEAT repeat domain-containing protein [Pirellulaceae bacterium]|nr:HEAT repeat domain-containing protein [Pirellulaceae bacterium]